MPVVLLALLFLPRWWVVLLSPPPPPPPFVQSHLQLPPFGGAEFPLTCGRCSLFTLLVCGANEFGCQKTRFEAPKITFNTERTNDKKQTPKTQNVKKEKAETQYERKKTNNYQSKSFLESSVNSK